MGAEFIDQEADDPLPYGPLDPTGIPRLDQILGGGIQRGALVLLGGSPGSGKTTFAAQLAFAAANAGRIALIFTAFSEPSSKIVSQLRSFRFFDPEMLGTRVQLISLSQFLPQGAEVTTEQIVAEARRQRAGLVVMDGFRGVRGALRDPQTAKEFLYNAGTALSILGATTLITTEANPHDPALFADATSADILLGLHWDLRGVRHWRAIEVIKARGAAPLPGLHGLGIGDEGLAVYPRLKARLLAEAEPASLDQVVTPPSAFALPELDDLLRGGLAAESATLVIGSPGTGKTMLGLHFALAGIAQGEQAVLLSFRETRRELVRKSDPFAFGPDLRAALGDHGGLTVLRHPPVERDADYLAHELLAELDRTGARRLVVDSLLELQRAVIETSDAGRVPNYLAALVEALRIRGVTSLFIQETGALAQSTLTLQVDLPAAVAANVMWLHQISAGGQLRRVLSVPKTRFSSHDATMREFTITAPRGISVSGPFETDPTVVERFERSQGGMQAHGPHTLNPSTGL